MLDIFKFIVIIQFYNIYIVKVGIYTILVLIHIFKLIFSIFMTKIIFVKNIGFI